MTLRLIALAAAIILPVAIPMTANAAGNLVTNGSFELTSTTSPDGNFQFSAGNANYNYGTVTGWASAASTGHTDPFNLLFKSNNAAANSASSPSNSNNYATNQYNDARNYLVAGYTGASPDGGNFLALDGDTNVNGYVTQTINGLTTGANYVLSFYWAATQMASASGNITEQIQASLGSQTFSTAVVAAPSGGFSGWFAQSFTFTAAGTSQVLAFLSVGTPAGGPPLALLDGVSLVAAPEPSTWAILVAGMAGVTFLARRRRRTHGAAA